jgi:enamine deaminase RidA (YjgF/YER057c/UK114 family)
VQFSVRASDFLTPLLKADWRRDHSRLFFFAPSAGPHYHFGTIIFLAQRGAPMPGTIDARLAELNITLPAATAPVANYVPVTRSGNLLYVSGQVSIADGAPVVGKLGDNMDVEGGAAAARLCGLAIIAQVQKALDGDLDRVAQIVKLTGFVNSTGDFTDQPKVINGASDLMVDVFGDKGRHARAAVSAAALPLGVAVEIEAIVEVV